MKRMVCIALALALAIGLCQAALAFTSTVGEDEMRAYYRDAKGYDAKKVDETIKKIFELRKELGGDPSGRDYGQALHWSLKFGINPAHVFVVQSEPVSGGVLGK